LPTAAYFTKKVEVPTRPGSQIKPANRLRDIERRRFPNLKDLLQGANEGELSPYDVSKLAIFAKLERLPLLKSN
jgi:hypothetical protein